MFKLKILALVPLFFLAACKATGPADDGWENQNEWVDNGRLLDDETKTIYSSERRAEQAEKTEKTVAQSNTSSGDQSAADFNDYQRWVEAKENNSEEYQRFKQWQEFENYQRWKQQQENSE